MGLGTSLLAVVWLAQASSGAAPQPPALRLGSTVVPVEYALELRLDPNRDDFSGVVKVVVDVRESVRVFWVNAAPNLTVAAADLESNGQHFKARMLPGGKDFAGFEFDAALPVGHANVRIEYTGKLELKSSNGLFRGKFGEDNYIFTQFEPIAARMAFPCFDEPAFKVPWQLTLEVPAKLEAFSNTPIQNDATMAGVRRVTFAKSKPMPSYLVALGVGPFDIVDAGTAGRKKTPIRIIVPHGRAAEAEYARKVTPGILAELEKYFDIPYPYEKLDEMAVPLLGGAMENAGLVTYTSEIILAPPNADSISRQRSYFITAAHELAHQWFGDLVTMAWWNDTWLNESFATWMESQITERLHPEWRNRVEEIDGHLDIMRQDALLSARRVRQPVESNDDIENSFDGITYIKGGGVIRMLETWMGEKAFQKGVHYHMTHHAFQNATAEDFLASLATATKLPVAPVMTSFVEQTGVPQVDVALDCTGAQAKVNLSQKRFLPLGADAPQDRLWKVPVCVKYPGGRECELVESKESVMVLKHAKGCPAWILANPELGGYYHARYDGTLLDQLIEKEFDRLDLPERVALLGDTSALTVSGAVKPSQALTLAMRVKDAQEHELLDMAIGIVESIERMVTPELRPNYVRLVRKMFGERAHALGWLHKDGEPEEAKLLRNAIVPFVAGAGEDPELISEAKALATKWLADHRAIPRDQARAVLTVAARNGDRDFFDRLIAAAKIEKDQLPREQILSALGGFRNPELIRAAEQLYLTASFDSRETWSLMFAGIGNPATRRYPFDFVKNNIDAIEKTVASGITGGEGNSAIIGVAGGFCDEAGRAEAEGLFSTRAAKYTGGPRTLAQTLERIHQCAARVSANSADVAAFLAKQ
jgi:alanyl aminopeptidase